MKKFLKRAALGSLLVSVIIAALTFHEAPAGNNVMYYVGWWIGSQIAGFFIIGVPVSVIVGLFFLLCSVFEGEAK